MNLPFIKYDGTAKLPKAIYLFPTLNCNLKCVMCDVDTRSSIDEELTPADYDRILKELNTWWKKPYLYIGGGEPLIYRHFNELMETIRRNRFEVMVNTNGMLLSGFAETIMDTNVKILIVSIDGREKTHNEIRGNKDSFSLLSSGIKEINRLKEKRKSAYPLIVISNVVVSQNYKEIYEFLEELNGLNVHSITIHSLKFITPERCEAQKKFVEEKFGKGHYYFPNLRIWEMDKMGFDTDILAEQIMRVEENRRRFNFKIHYARDYRPQTMIDYHTKGFSAHINNMSCYNIYNALNIGTYGDMCLCTNYRLGNIKEQPVKEAWNNDKARLLRRRYRENGSFPACQRCGGFSEK